MKLWIKCAALSRVVYGDTHWEWAKCHIHLAKAYLDLRSKSFILIPPLSNDPNTYTNATDLSEQALLHAVKGRDILLFLGGHVVSCDCHPKAVLSLALAHCIIGKVLITQEKYLTIVLLRSCSWDNAPK